MYRPQFFVCTSFLYSFQVRGNYTIVKNGKKMINAYMFMDVEPGCSQQTLTLMRRLNQIESVSVVSGHHDLIARVSVDDLERLHDITSEVHRIRGVVKTNTHVISKEINVCQ